MSGDNALRFAASWDISALGAMCSGTNRTIFRMDPDNRDDRGARQWVRRESYGVGVVESSRRPGSATGVGASGEGGG